MGLFSNDDHQLELRVQQLEDQVAQLWQLVQRQRLEPNGEPDGFVQPTWQPQSVSDDPVWLPEVRALVGRVPCDGARGPRFRARRPRPGRRSRGRGRPGRACVCAAPRHRPRAAPGFPITVERRSPVVEPLQDLQRTCSLPRARIWQRGTGKIVPRHDVSPKCVLCWRGIWTSLTDWTNNVFACAKGRIRSPCGNRIEMHVPGALISLQLRRKTTNTNIVA